jgi:hypothetical protein
MESGDVNLSKPAGEVYLTSLALDGLRPVKGQIVAALTGRSIFADDDLPSADTKRCEVPGVTFEPLRRNAANRYAAAPFPYGESKRHGRAHSLLGAPGGLEGSCTAKSMTVRAARRSDRGDASRRAKSDAIVRGIIQNTRLRQT